MCVPLSKIVPLLDGRERVRLNGEPLGMVLNNDKVIRLVLSMPAGRAFIERVRRPRQVAADPNGLAYLTQAPC